MTVQELNDLDLHVAVVLHNINQIKKIMKSQELSDLIEACGVLKNALEKLDPVKNGGVITRS